jgi:hypothetical protein
MKPLPQIITSPDTNPTTGLIDELKLRSRKLKRRKSRINLTLPSDEQERTDLLLLIGSNAALINRYRQAAGDELELELNQLPQDPNSEPLDFGDVSDARNFATAAAFTNLLDHDGYKYTLGKEQLIVTLEPDAGPDQGFGLAMLLNNAAEYELFHTVNAGSDDDNEPFTVKLEFDSNRHSAALFETVSSAEDYLVLAPDIERVNIGWNGDERQRDLLKDLCEICCDETGPGSSLSLRQHLSNRPYQPELMTRYRRAKQNQDTKELDQLWQVVFDMAIDMAVELSEEWLIVHVRDDASERWGIYLIERESLPSALYNHWVAQ